MIFKYFVTLQGTVYSITTKFDLNVNQKLTYILHLRCMHFNVQHGFIEFLTGVKSNHMLFDFCKLIIW